MRGYFLLKYETAACRHESKTHLKRITKNEATAYEKARKDQVKG